MRQPVLFIGHGSPMNAIEDNPYRRAWIALGQRLRRPRAILAISAHWETAGVAVTANPMPRTLHDFGGFPPALFATRYPAPGHPALALRVAELLSPEPVRQALDWGLDHGSWSVLLPMFPDADIPVVQLSLARGKSPAWHYALAQRLLPLRDEDVLVVASGDMVHNLGLLRWPLGAAAPWAQRVQDQFNRWIDARDHAALQAPEQLGREAQMAIPTPEHYLPVLYALALQRADETVARFNDVVTSSISMTSLIIGDSD